ncbi:Dabb family protein [bacterium]|nr:Dabb family protein [bacterium]
MIKHIVMWQLKEETEGGNKAGNMDKMRRMLEGLEESINQIRGLEVGINIPSRDSTHDIILSTEFRTMVELDIYRKHPEHLKVAEFIKKVAQAKAAVDYII